jgi:hypothetical protein
VKLVPLSVVESWARGESALKRSVLRCVRLVDFPGRVQDVDVRECSYAYCVAYVVARAEAKCPVALHVLPANEISVETVLVCRRDAFVLTALRRLIGMRSSIWQYRSIVLRGQPGVWCRRTCKIAGIWTGAGQMRGGAVSGPILASSARSNAGQRRGSPAESTCRTVGLDRRYGRYLCPCARQEPRIATVSAA